MTIERFLWNAAAYAAALALILGGAGLLIASVVAGLTVHYAWFGGLILVALWLAGVNCLLEYAVKRGCYGSSNSRRMWLR